MNNSIQISDNCWKHDDSSDLDDDNNIDVFYTKTSDPASELHRDNGPAREYSNGTKAWYINGKRHRIDGPAVEYASGKKLWYFHGKFINVNSQEEFEIYIKNILFI